MKMSMVVCTNKSKFLERFCNSFGRDALVRESPQDLEIIFVGPIGKDHIGFKAPYTIRVITSDANPALCWEIGARKATGDLLGFAPDDVVYSDGFLDNVLVEAARSNHDFDTFTARYVHNGVDQIAGQRLMSQADMPLLPVGGFMRRESHYKLGGIDKRFHAVLWDTNLYMTAHLAGGNCRLVGNHTCHEINDTSHLFTSFSAQDKEIMKSIWWKDEKWTQSRSNSVVSYSDDDINGAIKNDYSRITKD